MIIDSVFDCPRCLAKGYIDGFSHVLNGICFLCKGDKQITRSTSYSGNGLVLYYTKDWYWGHKSYDHSKPEWIRRHLVNLSFDGGNTVDQAYFVDDNPGLARAVYRWALDNGAQLVKKVDDCAAPPDRRIKLKAKVAA